MIVSNIQRFCLHDGPGIRTTVFFKGCNLRCPWCTNPENLILDIQEYEENNLKYSYGYEIELEKLEEEILKDKIYFDTDGGVTFSGGEALLVFDKIEPLLQKLSENNINMCVETALTVPEKYIDIALKYIDTFIIDIKILDEDSINKINGNVEQYLKNIKKIFKDTNNVIFRIPLVLDYTYTDENLDLIYEFLKKYQPQKVEIFKIHRLAEKKYRTLGKEMPMFRELSEDYINKVYENIKKLGILVEYIKI